MSSPAQVRASWVKYTVRSIKHYAAPLGQRVLDTMDPALRKEVREAGALGWLAAERFIALCTTIRDALGEDGARAFWRKSLHDCIKEPLIRPLAQGGIFLFGRKPEGLYRRTPQAWALVTRHTGEMLAEAGPTKDSFFLRVRGLPPECRATPLLHLWEGGFAGQADFVGFDATVATDDSALLEWGDADFLIRFQPKV